MPIPGRVVGVILNDVQFEVDPGNVLYGEGQGEKAPVGVYDYADRLITTVNSDENGAYEVLLPSTYTASCPTPSGVCPGMYKFVINDPGTKANPNAAYNPNIIGQTLAMDVWPGKTTYADTPVIPRNAQRCNDFTGPEIFQVSRVHMLTSATGAARSFVILGRNFGGSPSVTLGGVPINVTANTAGPNGTRQLTVAVPAANAGNGFAAAGPRQLRVAAAGRTTRNGLTFHLRGTGYLPNPANVITVNAGGSIQAAINAAPVAGDTLVDVAPGNYTQNVVLNKRVKLQGRGPGGFVGTQGPPNPPTEDPLQQTQGSVIDGRYFLQNEAAWNTAVASRPFAGNQDVRGGAAITVLGQGGAQAWTSGFPAAIDGFGITLGERRRRAAASTSTVTAASCASPTTSSSPTLASSAARSRSDCRRRPPASRTTRTTTWCIRYNRILSNGGRNKAGGIGIYNGAQNYTIADNDVCANASFEYGGGISHFGEQPERHDPGQPDHGQLGVRRGRRHPGRRGARHRRAERQRLRPGRHRAQPDRAEPVQRRRRRRRGAQRADLPRRVAQQHGRQQRRHRRRRRPRDRRLLQRAVRQQHGRPQPDDRAPRRTATAIRTAPGSSPIRTAPASTRPGAATFPNIAMFNNIFWQNRAFTSDASRGERAGRPGRDRPRGGRLARARSPRAGRLLTVPHGSPSGSNVIGQDPLFVNPFETLVKVSPGATTGPAGRSR